MNTDKNTQSQAGAGYAYPTYPFTAILGWSISRYELFTQCTRRYFFQYYRKHVPGVRLDHINRLRALTSTALATGTVVHDVIEAFLKRLQKSDTRIDRDKFFAYARNEVAKYIDYHEFQETYYKEKQRVSAEDIYPRVEACLRNFLDSPCFNWIFMKALTNKDNWLIEPEGFGETRIDGMKAYCKMDFLFPVDDHVYILDWKTGKKDAEKHVTQLRAYALAARHNFGVDVNRLFPKIIYLYPEVDELETSITQEQLDALVETIRAQTAQMQSYCRDVENNLPLDIDTFPYTEYRALCRFCNYREICACGH